VAKSYAHRRRAATAAGHACAILHDGADRLYWAIGIPDASKRPSKRIELR
jgi:hypothetical protein